ncbi:MAG: hypothetical protein ABR974_00230 [Bacteroidales bacterium]
MKKIFKLGFILITLLVSLYSCFPLYPYGYANQLNIGPGYRNYGYRNYGYVGHGYRDYGYSGHGRVDYGSRDYVSRGHGYKGQGERNNRHRDGNRG